MQTQWEITTSINAMATAIRSLPSALHIPSSIPLFLCPLLGGFSPTSLLARKCNIRSSKPQKRRYQLEPTRLLSQEPPVSSSLLALPRSCPGCGALTQTVNPEGAGFYNTARRSVKSFLAQYGNEQLGEAEIFKEVVGHASQDILRSLDIQKASEVTGGEPCRIYSRL